MPYMKKQCIENQSSPSHPGPLSTERGVTPLHPPEEQNVEDDHAACLLGLLHQSAESASKEKNMSQKWDDVSKVQNKMRNSPVGI